MASLGARSSRDWSAASTPGLQLSGPTSAPSLSYTAILQRPCDPAVNGLLLAVDAVGIALSAASPRCARAAGLPSMRLDNASSTERSVGRSRRLATGIDALATHPRVAEISAGGSAGRRR